MSLTKVTPALIQVANNVTSTTLGTANSIPSITFDAQGVITTASNTAIAINTADIADGAITSAKIAAGAVTPANGSINVAMIDVASSNGVGALKIPSGTDAQRPAGEIGYLRYNTSNNVVEVWDNNSSSWQVVGDQVGFLTVEYLVLAGGGGGGTQHGGGGGAGGLIYSSGSQLSRGTSYSITVGSGGAGSPAVGPAYNGNSTPGSVSSLGTAASALGGGGGGSWRQPAAGVPAQIGYNGGSGGGGGSSESDSVIPGGSGTPGQGNPGGNGRYAGGGGGGAGASGSSTQPASPYSNAQAANGGIGLAYSISGSSLFYAGGGGGGTYAGPSPFSPTFYRAIGGSSIGGLGGLGPHLSPTPTMNGSNGTVNRGSGGGGGGNFDATGGNGSVGVVIIRYSGAQTASGGTVTTSGANTIHTFTTSGTFTIN